MLQEQRLNTPDRIIQQAVRYVAGGVMPEGRYDHPLYARLLDSWLNNEKPPTDHPLLLQMLDYYVTNCEDIAELKEHVRSIRQRISEIQNSKPQKRWLSEHWTAAAQIGASFTRTLTKSKKGRNGTYILQPEVTNEYPYFRLRLIQPPSRKRGCTHDELGTVFCPVCGAKMWEDEKPNPEIIFPCTTGNNRTQVYAHPDGSAIEVPQISNMMYYSIAKSSKSPAQFFKLGPAYKWVEENVPTPHVCDGDDCPACEYGDP